MINTVAFTAADGRVERFPLDYLIEHRALVVDKIGGEDLSHSVGGANQLWIASSTARLFVRDIVKIDFLEEEVPPPVPAFEVKGMEFSNRPNVSAHVSNQGIHRCGTPIEFEGYASDYDKAIVGVQFSLDGGTTWTNQETPGATADRLVQWSFSYVPRQAGTYLLKVRSMNEDGLVSPVCAEVRFDVV